MVKGLHAHALFPLSSPSATHSLLFPETFRYIPENAQLRMRVSMQPSFLTLSLSALGQIPKTKVTVFYMPLIPNSSKTSRSLYILEQ